MRPFAGLLARPSRQLMNEWHNRSVETHLIEGSDRLDPDRDLIFKPRPYQTDILRLFEEKRAGGQRTFHLVAPPGSGKTIIGIALLMAIRYRGVVFSPNAAIQSQWTQRFYDCTAPINSNARDVIDFSCEPDSGATHLSLTYQSVATKIQGTGDYHPNALNLMDQLVQAGQKVLILDEVHHLTGFWGQTIRSLIERFDNPYVIGLTATPPIEATGSSLATYLEIVGPIDYQVPLPAVVKEKNLAPYQDLVYFTHPDESETKSLMEGRNQYSTLIQDLERTIPPIKPLSFWAERSLDESRPRGPGSAIVPFDEWLTGDPDSAIAFVRYLNLKGHRIPDAVILVDEMDAPFSVDDLALVLAPYLTNYLDKEPAGKDLCGEIKLILAELGFQFQNKVFMASCKGSARRLTLSKTKLEAMRTILAKEHSYQREDLRALVLTDFERGPIGEDCLTGIDVMRVLTEDEETDALDPILVTGRSVLVDDDLLDQFLEAAERFAHGSGLHLDLEPEKEGKYYRIHGRGKDWNTRTYVAFITTLLERGMTRCLIGTRALLGEGWDALSLNTLVDLTAVASFVSVNQIRGRTIRLYDENPHKCANNWDVVTVLPGLEHGLYDFKRLARKHEQFWGVSDDGVIEKGLGHVHPSLSKGSVEFVAANLESLNQDMLERARDRLRAYKRWRIGEPYRNRDLGCLQIRVPGEGIPGARDIQQSQLVEFVRVEAVEAQHRSDALTEKWWWIFGLPVLIARILLWYRWTQIRKTLLLPPSRTEEVETIKTLRQYGHVVLETLKTGGFIDKSYDPNDVQILSREGGYFRIYLGKSEPAQSDLFSESVWEMLGPIQNHKYVIEKKHIDIPLTQITPGMLTNSQVPYRTVSLHPVPSLFGRRRSLADVFHHAWNRHISPGELIYTRRKENRDRIDPWLQKRTLNLRRERKQIWE